VNTQQHTLFSLYNDVTIFSYFDQSGSIFVLVGVTKKTKCSPVLSSRRLLAFSKGDNTKIASVGGSPRKGREGSGGEGNGRDGGRWDRM
jgi:hypothetical protein